MLTDLDECEITVRYESLRLGAQNTVTFVVEVRPPEDYTPPPIRWMGCHGRDGVLTYTFEVPAEWCADPERIGHHAFAAWAARQGVPVQVTVAVLDMGFPGPHAPRQVRQPLTLGGVPLRVRPASSPSAAGWATPAVCRPLPAHPYARPFDGFGWDDAHDMQFDDALDEESAEFERRIAALDDDIAAAAARITSGRP